MHGIALVMVIDYVAIYTRLAKFQRNKLEPIALEVKLSIITTQLQIVRRHEFKVVTG